MKRHTGFLLVALPAIAMVCGCATMEALSLRKPTANLKGLRFESITLEGAKLLFDLEIANPNAVAFPLLDMDYVLSSGSRQLLAGSAAGGTSIPAKGTQTVTLPAKISYLELFEAFKGIKPGAKIPYNADLALSIEAPVIGITKIPLKKEGQLAVPTIPKINEIDWKTKILETLKKN